jgi:hypothetical protein
MTSTKTMAKKRTADAQPASEQVQFEMHRRLLYDVILKQAGTLAKAILEGVMNSVDSGSKSCHITLTDKTLQITDDGRGFRSRDEIMTWFKVFGQPHTEDEGKTYGRFRMGRGQLFAYGANLWRSNQFLMDVDFKNRGDKFELKSDQKPKPGCTIDIQLYDPLIPSELQETEINLKRWCRWVPIMVFLNDDPISHDVKEYDWAIDNADAYGSLDGSAQLRIYNQGIFVQEFAKHIFGTGGEIVSKQALEVNFARNEVQSTCPIWKRLKPLIDKTGRERVSRKPSLDDGERVNLLRRAARFDITGNELKQLKIFTAVTGQHYAIGHVASHKFRSNFTVCPPGDRTGDSIHRRRLAFVLSQDVLTNMGMTPQQFKEWACKSGGWYGMRDDEDIRQKFVPFEKLSKTINTEHALVAEKDYTEHEQVWMALLSMARHRLKLDNEQDEDDWRERRRRQRSLPRNREIVVGLSETMLAWTDGSEYIAFDRKFLAANHWDMRGLSQVGSVLLHEFCHDTDDLKAHTHDQTFYELFHDSAREFMGEFYAVVMHHLPLVLKRVKKKMSKKDLRAQDQLAKASLAQSKMAAQES